MIIYKHTQITKRNSGSFHNLLLKFSLFSLYSLPLFPRNSSSSLLPKSSLLLCHRFMASSDPDFSEVSSLFENMTRNRDLSLLLPFIFGFSPRTGNAEGVQGTEITENRLRERIILINLLTQGLIFIDGSSGLDTLFPEFSSKMGQPPASKDSTEALPSVEIKEGEEEECVICLEYWEIGGVAKEMPCKHKFHSDCIKKWLGIHGSCPVCRYQMPLEERDVGKKRDEEGGQRRRSEREVWVSFSLNNGGRSEDSYQVPAGDSNDSAPSARDDAEVGN